MKIRSKTRERLVGEDIKDASSLFYRHLAAYNFSAPFVKGKRLLDLGCSDGYGSFLLTKKTKSTVALDIDEKTVLQAKKKYKSENLNFVVGDGLNLKWRNKFDIVVSFQVIEHIREVGYYLMQIKKVLAANGIAIFSTPNRELRLGKGEKPWNPYHIREYEKQELYKLLSKYFSKVSLFGLQASSGIYSLEIKRLKLRRMIAKFDKFNLYNRFSREFTDFLLKYFKRLIVRNKKEQVKNISLNDFWVSDKKIRKSLDLIAVCFV